jgi:heptosyltransferase-2
MNSQIKIAGSLNKILIIRLSSIGDILLSTPFIRQVKQQFPEAQIDFLIKDVYKDLLKFNPHLNELYNFHLQNEKAELIKLKREFKKKSYDVIFDLHNSLRSNYLKHHSGAGKIRSIRKEKVKQTLLVWFKINRYDQAIPISERYLAVGRDFGVEDDGKGLEIYWDKQTMENANGKAIAKGIELKNQFFALAPGAGFFTKRWPLNKFEHLITLIQKREEKPIVIFGGEEDKKLGVELSKIKNVFDFCGQLSLLETAYLISKSKMIVSNDSGLMHMATAVQTPVLAIFGSTVKELGFFPYRSEAKVIENSEVCCRPCSHIGRHQCPKSHFKCMEDISPERVYDKLRQFLDVKR